MSDKNYHKGMNEQTEEKNSQRKTLFVTGERSVIEGLKQQQAEYQRCLNKWKDHPKLKEMNLEKGSWEETVAAVMLENEERFAPPLVGNMVTKQVSA